MLHQTIIASILIGLIAVNSHAASYYFVNGKQVANQGEAKRASMKDPKATVIKIQATQVQMNEETFNLKKSKDLSLDEVRKAIK